MTVTATKERPIIFSGDMVRAILDGRKTQTRRVVQLWAQGYDKLSVNCGGRGYLWYGRRGLEQQVWSPGGRATMCPHGRVGDHLWVRESHRYQTRDTAGIHVEYKAGGAVLVRSDDYHWDDLDPWRHGKKRWRSPMHMHRSASRIALEITDVRVQRVRDISGKDAIAEGVEWYDGGHKPDRDAGWFSPLDPGCSFDHAREAFKYLWNPINAKRGYGWDANPWVWVLVFKRIEETETETDPNNDNTN